MKEREKDKGEKMKKTKILVKEILNFEGLQKKYPDRRIK